MNALFARAIATAVVLFGLGSGTVALANDSLPDAPLYPVKLMLEETRMAMADNPVEQATLQTELAQVRLEEMTRLALVCETLGKAQPLQRPTHPHLPPYRPPTPNPSVGSTPARQAGSAGRRRQRSATSRSVGTPSDPEENPRRLGRPVAGAVLFGDVASRWWLSRRSPLQMRLRRLSLA